MKKPSYEALEAALKQITAIAHFGGLSEMSALDALRDIRHLTLKNHFDEIANKSHGAIRAIIKNESAAIAPWQHHRECELREQRDELLAALEKAFEMRVSCHPEWEAIARAAIARAKGGAL